MANALKLLSAAAREAVEDITEPYEDYRADLVHTFTDVLQVQQTEPNERSARQAVETLIINFADQVSKKLKEL